MSAVKITKNTIIISCISRLLVFLLQCISDVTNTVAPPESLGPGPLTEKKEKTKKRKKERYKEGRESQWGGAACSAKFCFAHNLLHITKPKYLHRLINIKPPSRTRSSDHLFLSHPPVSTRLKFADRSFCNSSPRL